MAAGERFGSGTFGDKGKHKDAIALCPPGLRRSYVNLGRVSRPGRGRYSGQPPQRRYGEIARREVGEDSLVAAQTLGGAAADEEIVVLVAA